MFRAEGAAPARIANPLAEDASVMRSTGAVTMARTLEWNLNHGQRNVRLFEFGKTYGWNGTRAGRDAHRDARRDGPRAGKRRRRNRTRLRVRRSERRPRPDRASRGRTRVDGGRSGVASWRACGNNFAASADGAAAQTDRACRAALAARLRKIQAAAGRVHRGTGTRAAVRGLQIRARGAALQTAFPLSGGRTRLLSGSRGWNDVLPASKKRFARLAIAEVSSIDAVDLFRGKNVPEGKFALLVRVRFESRQATLTEAQLTDFSSRILAALEQKLGATLRA